MVELNKAYLNKDYNISYNWPAFLAASWLNSGYMSSYALIRIHYYESHSNIYSIV